MATFTDDFIRADNADLGTNWTPLDGSMKISGNAARLTSLTTDFHAEYVNSVTLTSAQYAQSTLTIAGAILVHADVQTRTSTTATTFYLYTAAKNESFTSRIGKAIGGSFTQLSSEASTTWVTTDVLKGTVVSSELDLLRNGVSLITATDSAINSGPPGINGLVEAGFTEANLQHNAFEAGDIALPAGPTTAPSLNCWIGGYW
jgi:hypothetical protein